MRRTDVRARGRGLAAALLAAGVIAGPAVAPAAAADSIRDEQWHLDAMKAPEMWQTTRGQGVTVAVIDSGFKLDHPDLAGQLLPGKDFSGLPGGVGLDKEGHGTGIAGLIAGSGKGLGGKGATGLAPDARILPLKIRNNASATEPVSSSEFLKQIGQAIVYAADQGAKVINVSQGTANQVSAADVNELTAAVAKANAKGSLVVASVGNEGDRGNPVHYPGALPGVLGVASTDRTGAVTSESEHGSQVDLAAPGQDVYTSCVAASGYCKTHGTSDSAALVSASAALVWAVHPDWNANQVARVLINTAGKPEDGSNRNDFLGFGIVRPRVALSTPGDPGPADVNPLAAPAGGGPSAATSGAGATPSAGGAAPTGGAPSVPAAGGQPGSAPAAQPAAGGQGDSGSALPIVAAVAGAVLLAAVVVVVLVLRRRSAARSQPPAAPVDGPAPVAPPVPAGYPAAGPGPLPGQPQPTPQPAPYPHQQAPHQQAPQPQAPQSGYGQPLPPQGGPGATPPPPPSYGPPAPPAAPGDNPYAR